MKPIIANEHLLSAEGKHNLLKWRAACFDVVNQLPQELYVSEDLNVRSNTTHAFYAMGLLFDLANVLTIQDCLNLADVVLADFAFKAMTAL